MSTCSPAPIAAHCSALTARYLAFQGCFGAFWGVVGPYFPYLEQFDPGRGQYKTVLDSYCIVSTPSNTLKIAFEAVKQRSFIDERVALIEKLAKVTGRTPRSSDLYIPFACIFVLYDPNFDAEFVRRPPILPPAGARAATTLPFYMQNPSSTGSKVSPNVRPYRCTATFSASKNAPEACTSSVEALDRDREEPEDGF